MPPPTSKPSTDRRLSNSLSSISSVRTHRRSEDKPGSPPASIKSFDDRMHFTASPTSHVYTTATDPTVVTTASTSNVPGLPVLSPSAFDPTIPNHLDTVSNMSSLVNTPTSATKSEASLPAGQTLGSKNDPDTALPTRATPRVINPRSISTSRRLSTTGSSKTESATSEKAMNLGRIGVCALDVKARSRPSRQILTRLQGDGDFEVIVFGDKAILDEGMSSQLFLL
jgi:hypothetical protein